MKQLKGGRLLLTFAVLLMSGMVALSSTPADAVSGSEWNASNIIDDAVFYNNATMSVDDIQAFMNSKNPSCDTDGSRPASEYGRSDLTHAQYATQVKGWPGPPYVCLKDYYQVPRSDQVVSNLSTNVRPDGSISAAQIIKNASDTYGLNPKVLLVLIQKESVGPLLTDTWPMPSQYKSVVGYACPDTAPCDPKYAGFYNQIMNAAYQFKYYKDHAYDKNGSGNYIYRHQPYNTVSLLFNPNTSCGSTQTRMDNYATTGLYNYTPYQPNQAALNNMYGTGDGCSAYGNRNFWRMFIDWFNTVRGSFQNLQQPRWMQLAANTQKIDPVTGQSSGDTLTTDQQIKFVTKIDTGFGPCLRTQYDTNNNNRLCVPMSKLKELTITYSSLPDGDKLKMLKQSSHKQNLRTNNKNTDFPLEKSQQLTFDATATIGGTTYYITRFDYQNGVESGIPGTELESSASYETITPTRYRLTEETSKLNPLQQRTIDTALPSNTIINYTSRTSVNGTWHYRTEHDTSKNLDKAIPESKLSSPFENFQQPRWMKVLKPTQKVDPFTGQATSEAVSEGSALYFNTKITTNDKTTYFRTNSDGDANKSVGIRSEVLADANFEPLKQPRWMVTTEDTQRVSPYTGQVLSTIPKGTQLKLATKIDINGNSYFRTEEDTNANLAAGIKSSSVNEIKYAPFLNPRELRLKTNTYKQVPSTGASVDNLLDAGMVRKYSSKIEIDGKVYYRTENDTVYDLNKAILADYLEDK